MNKPSYPNPAFLQTREVFHHELFEGYNLNLFRSVQIIPINVAAAALESFWLQVMVEANRNWKFQSLQNYMTATANNLQIEFLTAAGTALDWTTICLLAGDMKRKVPSGGAWAGFFQGEMTNTPRQIVITVTMKYVGQRFLGQ